MIPEGESYNENPNQNKFWLVFIFYSPLKSKLLAGSKIQKPETFVSGFLLRRKRDYNKPNFQKSKNPIYIQSINKINTLQRLYFYKNLHRWDKIG